MIAETWRALAILDRGGVPAPRPSSPAWGPGPAPIYDALLREVTTGRDATGRFVRRWVA